MTILVRRAQVAARIDRACRVAPTAVALLAEVGRLIAQVVSHDERDLQVYDPEAMIPVAAVSGVSVPMDVRLAHCELEQHGQDAAHFRTLARSRPHIVTLDRATAGRPQDSRRYRELLAPAGVRHELRAVFLVQDSCWGAMVLLRHGGDDFSGADQRWLASVAPRVALALRRHVLATTPPDTSPGAGVLSVRPGIPPVPVTAAGRQWLDGLSDGLAVQAVASRARRHATAVVRVASSHGWAALEAAQSRHDDDEVLVVVRPAGGPTVMPILARAYGLTSAQRGVVALVMHGCTARQISNRLMISEETVRDHLRAAYRKTGTTSAGTLRHRLTLEVWNSG